MKLMELDLPLCVTTLIVRTGAILATTVPWRDTEKLTTGSQI